MEAPVIEGETLKLKLLGTGSKGDFYGKKSGYIIFVRDLKKAQPNEIITVEITDVKERCAFAKKI